MSYESIRLVSIKPKIKMRSEGLSIDQYKFLDLFVSNLIFIVSFSGR